jgi:hypothetical protein
MGAFAALVAVLLLVDLELFGRSGEADARHGGARTRPRAGPGIIRPVGVGLRSPSPTGVVGLTTTTSGSPPAASASRSATNDVRLYGIASSAADGPSSSVASRPSPDPHVLAVLVCTSRRTPRPSQAATTLRVPWTLTSSICRGSAS